MLTLESNQQETVSNFAFKAVASATMQQFPLIEGDPGKFDNADGDSCEPNLVLFVLGKGLPKFDWRGKGVLPPVVNLGMEPTWWVHHVTGTLEAGFCIENNQTVRLSKQQLLDYCQPEETKPYPYDGRLAFEFIIKNGITLESEYPVIGSKGNAPVFQEPYFTLDSVEYVLCDDEVDIKRRVFQHPLYATLLSMPSLLRLGKDCIYRVKKREYDIFAKSCETHGQRVPLHAVLLIGWDEIEGVPVWVAQNSYGDMYADNGYFYITRNSSIKDDEYASLIQVLDVKGFKVRD